MEVAGALSLALGLAAIGAALVWRPGKGDAVAVVGLGLMGLFFALTGAYLIAWIRTKRVLLFSEAIELVDLGYRRRRMLRDEIVGLRVIPLQYGFQQIIFELRGPGRRSIKTDLYCERDAVLLAWLAAIPNLDVLERERAEAELLQRPELGGTEEERRQSLVKARSIARAANALAVAAMAWGWVYPRPYSAAIVTLALIPLATIGLLLGSRGRYSIEGRRNDVRPSLLIPLFGPGAVLVLRALHDFRVVDWRPLILWTGPGALVLIALTVIGDPALRRRWFTPLVLLLLLGGHPWGTLMMTNALLDRSAPERFRVAVTDKYISSGKAPSNTLWLAPWGPSPRVEVMVPRALYQAVEVGGTVCVELHPGALGFRWFIVRACEGSVALPPDPPDPVK